MKAVKQDRSESARAVAASAIARAAADFPDVGPPDMALQSLDDRDRRLCLAIYRTTMQRWKTLAFLLDQRLKKPSRKLHPDVQGILLTGAAQLLFMDRIPAHAVVDAAVGLSRATGHSNVSGVCNAVLRRVSEMAGAVHADVLWTPATDRLPLGAGYLELVNVKLPRTDNLINHLAIATSMPITLLTAWQKEHGTARLPQLAVHSCENPPTIVAVEDGCVMDDDTRPLCEAHATQGFYLWQGGSEELGAFLAGHLERRVQDPAAALAVDCTIDLKPRLIVDYCAGRGTKTRQLAAKHPEAIIIASDPDNVRLADLQVLAKQLPNVTAVHASSLHEALAGRQADLVLLDVPCSNTGVLARRPEARYRYSAASLHSLVELQREIIDAAMPLVASGGHVLYSTCSMEQVENQHQATWLLSRHAGHKLHEGQILPSGSGVNYHDGSYSLLVRVGA